MRPSNNYSMQLNNAMLDFVGANFLTQLTDRPTRNDNILDLTLTTNPAFSLNNGMLDFVSANFLTKLTDIPTRNDNILDLALTTNPAFSQPHRGACWSVVYRCLNNKKKKKKKNAKKGYFFKLGSVQRCHHLGKENAIFVRKG